MNLSKARKILELSLAEYSRVRATYYSSVYDIVSTFLTGKGSTTGPSNSMKRAMSDAVFATGTIAWQDGGAELPIEQEAFDLIQSIHSGELVNIDTLFQRLLSLRRDTSKNELDLVAEQEAGDRAEGYCGTLDFLYSQVKLLAGGNKMLTFVGVDGQSPFPCPECRRYKNKRHSAKWWVQNDAVPGSVTGFTCKGYNCKHVLVDDGGQIWTL